jgi:hypothetical protein
VSALRISSSRASMMASTSYLKFSTTARVA